jgi:acetyl esterase/lipase
LTQHRSPSGVQFVALKAMPMPSWQSHLLRLAQRGFRLSSRRFTGLDVIKERRDTALMEKLYRLPAAVQCSPVAANGVPAEWLDPAGSSAECVAVYVHGGGFHSGTVRGARLVAAPLALASRARFLTLGYRLAPEHPFPAALDDARAAYDWLLAAGHSPEHLVLVGDSAGGTLVLALLIQLRDQGRPLPRAAVCLSPATDLTLSGETWTTNARADLLLDPRKIRAAVDLYLHGADPRNPLASPLYADLHGLPPLLLLVGSDEQLLSDTTRFALKAQAAGVAATLEVWDRMQHGWHITASVLPEGRQAQARIAAFISSTS